MKKYFYLLAATAFMASCSNEDFVGEAPASAPQAGKSGAIEFAGIKPNMVRGTSADAAKLGNVFNVFGTKGTGTEVENVFAQVSDATIQANSTYGVWFVGENSATTTSNSSGWEYVGTPTAGDATGTAQTIKYWDWAAPQYDFVAYANTNGATVSNITTTGFDVTATPDALAGLFIADKKVVEKTDYNNSVIFTFRSAATKVRLGIYETVPGYQVESVQFVVGGTVAENDEAVLEGSFVGSPTEGVTCKVTFDPTDNKAIVTTNGGENYNPATSFNFGTFPQNTLGETAAAATWAVEANATAGEYINVQPNITNFANMILTVNYTLTNTESGETIQVSGAKAVVPAAYMKWQPNYAYTYLFKITDNTNGKTDPTQPTEGLFPITFDAVVEETVDAETQTTITTVSTPSITTHQENFADKYVAGDINVTVEGVTLSNTTPIAIYSVTAGTTEADLMLNAPTGATLTATYANGVATFNATAAGTYAVQYEVTPAAGNVPAVYAYKVIVVE